MTASASIDRPADRRLSPVLGYGAAVLLTAAATLAAVVVDRLVAIPNLSLVFVLPVVIAAITYGWGPAMAAAVLGVVAFNFFLIAPRHSFEVRDPANVWAIVLLMAVAAIVSALAAQSRRRAVQAREAAARSEVLQGLARALVAAAGARAIAEAAAAALRELFSAPSVVLIAEGDALSLTAPDPGEPLSDADMEAAHWALASRLATRAGAYPIEAARFDFWPVLTPSRLQAVIGMRIGGRDEGRPLEPERLVESVGGYLAVALERDHYAAQALAAEVERASQSLKSDLLAAVSHDLRTPLATIVFTLQSLQRFAGVHEPETQAELLALAQTEAERLTRLVSNLLDMGRLDADAVVVQPEPAWVHDLVEAALRRLPADVAGRVVVAPAIGSLPPVRVDAALAETALANLIDNGAKYSGPDSPVEVAGRRDGAMAVVTVADTGPGFAGPVEPLFEKFTRGEAGDGRPPGTGLGLSIARGFAEAFGGRVEAENRPSGPGAVVRLFLPIDGEAS